MRDTVSSTGAAEAAARYWPRMLSTARHAAAQWCGLETDRKVVCSTGRKASRSACDGKKKQYHAESNPKGEKT